MKRLLLVSTFLSLAASASLACSLEDAEAKSQEIASLIQDIVVQENADMAEVVAILQSTPVTKNRLWAGAASCTRQAEMLAALTTLSARLTQERTRLTTH